MPNFHVIVKCDAHVLGLSPLVLERNVKSQNAAHAAACGLSLAGGEYADVIEVVALAPVPGRSPLTIFKQCSQGVYGFCYGSRQTARKG